MLYCTAQCCPSKLFPPAQNLFGIGSKEGNGAHRSALYRCISTQRDNANSTLLSRMNSEILNAAELVEDNFFHLRNLPVTLCQGHISWICSLSSPSSSE